MTALVWGFGESVLNSHPSVTLGTGGCLHLDYHIQSRKGNFPYRAKNSEGNLILFLNISLFSSQIHDF